jgi:hypothetical protein
MDVRVFARVVQSFHPNNVLARGQQEPTVTLSESGVQIRGTSKI